jgi:Na+-driven multidrug efflux pump
MPSQPESSTKSKVSRSKARSIGVWLLRICLILGIVYATFACVFYGWYAEFPGPNQGDAALVANIWSVVAIACIAALAASFFGGQTRERESRGYDG